jgi:Spy/CpxP family protein refolding chaperone
MYRTLLRATALVVVPALLAVGAVAQDKSKDKDKDKDKGKKTSHERLQPYWTQLELTEKQRTEYDRVAHEYGPRIKKLRDELEAVEEKRHKDWMAILSTEQKEKLEHLRANRGGKKSETEEKHEEMETKPSKSRKDGKKPSDQPVDDVKPTKKKTGTKKDDSTKRDDG